MELKRWQDFRNPGSVDVDPLFPANKLPAHEVGYPGGVFAPFVVGGGGAPGGGGGGVSRVRGALSASRRARAGGARSRAAALTPPPPHPTHTPTPSPATWPAEFKEIKNGR